jgi:hypothetical protein
MSSATHLGYAVETTRRGAFPFFERPFTKDRLLVSVTNALREFELNHTLQFYLWAMQGDRRSTVYAPALAYANDASTRDSGVHGSYESNWYPGNQGANEYTYTVRGDYDTRSSLEARMLANTLMGTADIPGRYNDTSDMVEVNGRLSTSFATSGRVSAIGGKRRSESAFLERVEGQFDAQARFNVLVNGSVRGQWGANETLLIPVSPHNTCYVELQETGEILVTLNNRVYRKTLYPGSIVNLSWQSQVINIAIGRLVDGNGVPVTNAVIHYVVGIAMTDENGIFQAEVKHDTNNLDVVQSSRSCRAAFDNPRTNDKVLPLGALICQ